MKQTEDPVQPVGSSLNELEEQRDEQLIDDISHELEVLDNIPKITENPDWDGSESELVSDDDAEEYEIPETGIKISYSLTPDEMYKCLYHSRFYKTKGSRAVIQSIIFAFAGLIFLLTYFFTDSQYNQYNLFFGILCFFMIAVIGLVPHFHMKSLARLMADGKTVDAEIYPTHIDIGKDDGAWSIELDGKAEIAEFDNIIMIYTDDEKSFAIPERVIEPEVYNEIKAILLSGTMPEEIS
jgi:hypothetical protein